MRVWRSATRLPTVMVSTASTATSGPVSRRSDHRRQGDHAAQLRGRRQVRRDRHRRAVVGGRRPGVQRDRRHLEGEADHQQRAADRGQRGERAGAVGERPQVQSAGGGVQQGRTEQGHRRGDHADQEERHRGRGAGGRRPLAGGEAAQADQDVQRQGQGLQADDQGDQVAGVGDHHAAGHRAGQQEAELAGRGETLAQRRARTARAHRRSARRRAPPARPPASLPTQETVARGCRTWRAARRPAIAQTTVARRAEDARPATWNRPKANSTTRTSRAVPAAAYSGSRARWSTAWVIAALRSGRPPGRRRPPAPARAPGRRPASSRTSGRPRQPLGAGDRRGGRSPPGSPGRG